MKDNPHLPIWTTSLKQSRTPDLVPVMIMALNKVHSVARVKLQKTEATIWSKFWSKPNFLKEVICQEIWYFLNRPFWTICQATIYLNVKLLEKKCGFAHMVASTSLKFTGNFTCGLHDLHSSSWQGPIQALLKLWWMAQTTTNASPTESLNGFECQAFL